MPSQLTKERKAIFNKPSTYSIPLLSWIDIKSTDTFFFFYRTSTNFEELNQNKYQKCCSL